MDAQAAILTRGKTTARVKRRRRVECVPGRRRLWIAASLESVRIRSDDLYHIPPDGSAPTVQ
jgi:hypothetical protein